MTKERKTQKPGARTLYEARDRGGMPLTHLAHERSQARAMIKRDPTPRGRRIRLLSGGPMMLGTHQLSAAYNQTRQLLSLFSHLITPSFSLAVGYKSPAVRW